MRLNPLSLMGGAYADNSLTWSAQRTLNWLPETAEVEGTRTPIKFADAPGLRRVVDLGTGAPIRGIENVEGTLFVVSGTTLFEIASDYTATNRGNIPGVGRVSMAHNKQGGTTAANQLAIANGLSGYVYNTSTNVLSQITDESFEGASTVDYIDGFITFTDPQGRFWGHSALNQAGEYSSVDRYDAESAPDPIISHIASHREAIVFGTRTTEFFRNTGAATNTFQRVDGTELEVGICSTFARARVDNSVCWVSDSLEVFRLEGHSPQRISTRPIEQLLHTVNPANIFAFSWEDRGHKVFYITAPEAFTLGFDFASGMWHERQTFDLPRWRVNALASWNNQWIAGDYTNGLLYVLDWDTHHENGLELIRERASGYTHGGQNMVLAPYVELLFDTGAEGSPPLTISGSLPDTLENGDPISPYSYTATGGLAPYSFIISAGALPPGLSLSSAGVVTGAPSAIGSYSWTVRVTDTMGDTAEVDDSTVVQESWATTVDAFFIGGIRKLVEGYGGQSIRVRRVSDSVEQDIGFINRTLDTATLALFAGSGTVEVVKIYKQGGTATAPDFTCADLTKRPLIVSSGTYLGHLQFLSTGSVMMLSNAGAANAGPLGGWVGMTVCTKLGVPTVAAGRYVFSKSDSNGPYNFPNFGSFGWMTDDGSNITVTMFNSGLAARNKYPLASIADGTKISTVWDTAAIAPNQVKLYQSGAVPAETFVSSLGSPFIAPHAHYIAGNGVTQESPCEVHLQSICIYEAALSTTVRESVEAAL